ncbi:MAG: 2Fe-2S iron-sulfur cluster binding domain-containing protein [Rubrivivax sp.]|nr:2Fe-2S iron-sulfur cluster binding domain-containing protein [Rubrivivax sp.]
MRAVRRRCRYFPVSLQLNFIAHDGTHRVVEAAPGKSAMWAAVQAGVEGIAADCGGTMTCATCHVSVPAEWAERLPAPSADEHAMLEMTAAPREAGSRLSCQLIMTPELHGLVLRLPPTQY